MPRGIMRLCHQSFLYSGTINLISPSGSNRSTNYRAVTNLKGPVHSLIGWQRGATGPITWWLPPLYKLNKHKSAFPSPRSKLVGNKMGHFNTHGKSWRRSETSYSNELSLTCSNWTCCARYRCRRRLLRMWSPIDPDRSGSGSSDFRRWRKACWSGAVAAACWWPGPSRRAWSWQSPPGWSPLHSGPC